MEATPSSSLTIPDGHGQDSASIPRCCCGRDDCAFLQHNGRLVDGLERDVHQAAKLGQALLVRHEAYIADAEQERKRMAACIEKLEQEKRELQEKNVKTEEENRGLLEQLDNLNHTVTESDAHVQSLNNKLKQTEEELLRVKALASKTESLEIQLEQSEREQAYLQETLTTTAEEEKAAVQRWKNAERTIVNLQNQVDRIERESRAERERHVEIIGRMERRRVVEAELDHAAGRLKGAAAAKAVAAEKRGSTVVSHFVKDILQDNANLQMGIVELREMLMNSNEEVERLREQLMALQPFENESDGSRTPTLLNELGLDAPRQEYHIHHHYHGPNKAEKRNSLQRRSKKRRTIMSPLTHTPRTSISKSYRNSASPCFPSTPSSSAAILSQTSVTVPHTPRRWSAQSSLGGASIASSSISDSPYAHSHRASSIFDRGFSEYGCDSSRPTSPESNGTLSPAQFGSKAMKMQSYGGERTQTTPSRLRHGDSLRRSFTTPMGQSTDRYCASPSFSSDSYYDAPPHTDVDDLADLHYMHNPPTIPEEMEENGSRETANATNRPTQHGEPDIGIADIYSHLRPNLRRVSSHDSLISISGMDIHTLSSRPSQLLTPFASPFGSPATSQPSTQPVLSSTNVRANMSRDRRGLDSKSILYCMATEQRINSNRTTGAKTNKESFGKKVGGWVFGRWGATPAPTSSQPETPTSSKSASSPLAAKPPISAEGDSQETNSSDTGTLHVPSDPRSAHPHDGDNASILTASTGAASATSKSTQLQQPVRFRSPGINQSGPLLGFFEPKPTPTKIVVRETDVDREALMESLAE